MSTGNNDNASVFMAHFNRIEDIAVLYNTESCVFRIAKELIEKMRKTK